MQISIPSEVKVTKSRTITMQVMSLDQSKTLILIILKKSLFLFYLFTILKILFLINLLRSYNMTLIVELPYQKAT